MAKQRQTLGVGDKKTPEVIKNAFKFWMLKTDGEAPIRIALVAEKFGLDPDVINMWYKKYGWKAAELEYEDCDPAEIPGYLEDEYCFTPHAGQEAIIEELFNYRFHVVACGRQWGKSALVQYIIKLINDKNKSDGKKPGRGWIVAPNYSLGSIIYGYLKEYYPPSWIKKSRDSTLTMWLADGCRIDVKSADGDKWKKLKGAKLDWVILEEASLMYPEDIWTECLLPTLTHTHGIALFIFSPKGKGHWTHKLYKKGTAEGRMSPKNREWISINRPTWTCPLPAVTEALVTAKDNMPDHLYRQEYGAEFLDDVSGVFPNIDKCSTGRFLPGPVRGRKYVGGVDTGRRHDYTVVIITDAADGHVVLGDRFQTESWETLIDRVGNTLSRWCVSSTLVDATSGSQGDVIFEMLKKNYPRLNLKGYDYLSPSGAKQALINRLIKSFEKETIVIPSSAEFPELHKELHDMQYEMSARGHISYCAPRGEGYYDDCVNALALANYQREELQVSDNWQIKTGDRNSVMGDQLEFASLYDGFLNL